MFRFLIALSLLIPNFGYAYECNKEIDELSKVYQIQIICKENKNSFYESISYKRSRQYLIDDVYPYLKKFLLGYDKSVVKNNINELVLAENVKLKGKDVGGLSNGSKIIICLDDYSNKEYTYLFILNHEFSSNILYNASYDNRIAWREVSALYDNTYEYLVLNLNSFDFSRQTSEKLLNDGLLTNYSATNKENDFNVYAEKVFSGEKVLYRYKNQYPKVAKKLKLFKQIYREAGYTGKFPDEP